MTIFCLHLLAEHRMSSTEEREFSDSAATSYPNCSSYIDSISKSGIHSNLTHGLISASIVLRFNK